MNKEFEKIIEKLEEKARFYNSASDVDQNIRSGVIIAKEIVQETAAEYEVCYNDCGDCEAYNKEKHHCPKFCKVITETVREIEENHNDSRQFANIIKEVCCKKDDDYDNAVISPKFLNDTIENLLIDFAPQYNNGWIPVSDRLPNQDGEFTDVLITCESIADGVFVQSAEFYIATDGEPIFDALYHYESVLAWQPLPKPYQPKGE